MVVDSCVFILSHPDVFQFLPLPAVEGPGLPQELGQLLLGRIPIGAVLLAVGEQDEKVPLRKVGVEKEPQLFQRRRSLARSTAWGVGRCHSPRRFPLLPYREDWYFWITRILPAWVSWRR